MYSLRGGGPAHSLGTSPQTSWTLIRGARGPHFSGEMAPGASSRGRRG